MNFVAIRSDSVFLFLQFLLKENASLGNDSDITMEIPTNTPIAYSLIELKIKHDGQFGEKSFIVFVSVKLTL